MKKRLNFAIELDSNFISFYTATPLPGTKFFAYAMLNRLAEGNMDFKSAYYAPVVKSHELSKERIFELHKLAVRRFLSASEIYSKNTSLIKKLFRI